MGTATPPGRDRAARASLRGNEGNEGGRTYILKEKGGSRSSLDRLLFASSLLEAGSAGTEVSQRDGLRLLPPSFLHRHGWVLASRILPGTQFRLGPARISFPFLPRHYPPYILLPGYDPPPPRYQPHSPTSWPRPCRRISPPARPGGLAAAAALGPP